MSNEFEISMIGDLKYFPGLQIKQTSSSTLIHQRKYAK